MKKETISDRLKYIEATTGLTESGFAKVGCLPLKLYKDWKKGVDFPSNHYITRIAEVYCVCFHWLKFGHTEKVCIPVKVCGLIKYTGIPTGEDFTKYHPIRGVGYYYESIKTTKTCSNNQSINAGRDASSNIQVQDSPNTVFNQKENSISPELKELFDLFIEYPITSVIIETKKRLRKYKEIDS